MIALSFGSFKQANDSLGLKPVYVAIAALLWVTGARADTSTPEPNEVIAAARKIVTGDSVQFEGAIRLGGIEQWISIRGRHRRNPILLFIHGGPGFTSIPASWYYQSGWEEYFTVVQWDQRGAGKTYAINDLEPMRSTMTIERMAADAEELAKYLRASYGKRKIVLMAHSWGSVLGVILAQRHPDWFYAYVGVGQAVAMARSEALGYRSTLAAARADGNKQAIADLERMAPFPDLENPQRTLDQLEKERHWLTYYNGYTWHNGDGHDGAIGQLSPDYSTADRKARSRGLDFSLSTLWPALLEIDFLKKTGFGCPVVSFQGRHDLTTSKTLLAEWYAQIKAPKRTLIWFEDSAHMVIEEEPAKVLHHLVKDVLPLTQE